MLFVVVGFLLSLRGAFFWCRCGGTLLLLLSLRGARFFCSRCGPRHVFLLLSLHSLPGAYNSPRSATTAKKQHTPRNDSKKNAPPQRLQQKRVWQRQQKNNVSKKNTLTDDVNQDFFFAVVAGGAFFFLCCRCGNRGSLTHRLPGSARREQKQHKTTTAKKHGSRDSSSEGVNFTLQALPHCNASITFELVSDPHNLHFKMTDG